MRFTAILLLATCLAATAAGHSQTITLNEKKAPLQKIFKAINKQTGYQFFYKDELLDKAGRVDIVVTNATIDQVLTLCFRNLDITYKIVDKTIVVQQKSAGNGLTSDLLQVTSPPIDIHGRIINEKGLPVLASVQVKGTMIGTTTNSNGEFELEGVDDHAILVISGISIETSEVHVNGRSDLATIGVKTKITTEEEVKLISTGYQNIQPERFVGSAVKLDSATYHRRAGLDILERLDGTVAGIHFNKKGGSAPLQIRGISTIGLRAGGSLPANDPLIIVDNFPYTGDLKNINPNDVQDITVLKDAAAASIWGTRAGNGVIVITTKKSRYNQPFTISYSSNIGIYAKPDLFYFPQISSSDFIDTEIFLFEKDFYNNQLNNPKFNVISPVIEILDKKRKGLLTADQAEAQINELKQKDVRKDYENYVFRNQVQQQHYVSLSGGAPIYNYNLSLGFNHTLSNLQHTKPSQQFTLNSNHVFRPVKNIQVTIGLNLSKNSVYASGLSYPINSGGGKSYLYPYASLADEAGHHLAVPKDYGMNYTDTAGAGRLLDWKYRPLDEIRLANDRTSSLFARVNLGVSYNITRSLKAEVQYQYISQTGENRNLQGIESYATRDLINRFTDLNQTAPHLRNPIPIGDILSVNHLSNQSSHFRASLNFTKAIGADHDLSAFIASDLSESKGRTTGNRFYGYNDNLATYATGLDYATRFTYYDGLGSGKIIQGNTVAEGALARFVSLSVNGTYTFRKRYTLYLSARRDGANVFGVNTNNKWKPLWSSGASWEISKEKFYSVSWMSYLRLRASFGYMGNVDNARSGMPTIGYSTSNLPLTNLPAATIGDAPNPDLKWEEVRTTNIGFDFSLFKNRLTGSLEWYQKNSKDIISNTPFDPTTGIPSFVVNAANLKGNGVELQLNAVTLKANAFTWATGFALAYNKTIVTKFYNGGFKTNQFTLYGINPAEGKIAWGVSSYRWAGLDPQTGNPRGYLNKEISTNYSALLNDSVNNQVFHGSSIPLYTGFLSNTFSWKQFSLSANIRYHFDYYFRKPTINYSNLFNSWLGHADYAKRWKAPGDEQHTSVPSMIYPDNSRRNEFFQNSEVNVLRGDHVRLQDIRLSYNWAPKSSARRVIHHAQLFVYANNLNVILWRANKEKLDPEFTGGSSGIDLPAARSWTFGLSLGF